MADGGNPFAKYVSADTSPAPDNPFLKYSAQTPDQAQTPAAYQGLPDYLIGNPDPRPNIDAAADAKVAQERRQNAGIGQNIDDAVRNVVSGIPVVGGLAPQISAYMNSRKTLFGDQAPSYDEALAHENAIDRAIDKSSTKTGVKVPEFMPTWLGGGHDINVADLEKGAGAIATTPYNLLRVMRGTSLLPTMINSGATGALWGGADAAARNQGDLSDRAAAVPAGLAAGGFLGTIAPPIAHGIANTVGAAATALTPLPAALRNFEPGAVSRVARAAADDNAAATLSGATRRQQLNAVTTQERQLGRPLPEAYDTVSRANPMLGNDAMLLDAGPNLRSQASGLAMQPGPQSGIIRDAITTRKNFASQRIFDTVNDTLGPAAADALKGKAMIKQANAQATPFYDQFRATPIKPTQKLVDLMDRAGQAGAFDKAVKQMRIEGVDPNAAQSNGQLIDYVKQAIDDMASTEKRSGAGKMYGAYSKLAREIRNETDDILVQQGAIARDAHGNPIKNANGQPKSIWEHARDLSGEGKDLNEAIELGNKLFQRNLSPAQLKAEMAGMTPVEAEAVKQGGRNAVRNTANNAATALRGSADSDVRRQLMSAASRQKLAQVMPGDPTQAARSAGRLANTIDREARFAANESEVLGNSATANRLKAQEEFPNVSADAGVGVKAMTAEGAVFEGARRIANMLTGNAMNERNIRIATDAARMLTSKGVAARDIANALAQVKRGQATSQAQRAMINRVITNLIRTQSTNQRSSAPRS